MSSGVGEVAHRVGRSRATIKRMIAAGTLSASRAGPGLPWVIDAAELARVFPASARELPAKRLSEPSRASNEPAVIAAKQATDAAGIFDATKQPGIADAFVSLNLSEQLKTPFLIRVGAFTGRYGIMGEYDAGRYGTPLARTSTIGVTTSMGADLGHDLSIALEHGIGTSLARPGNGILPEGWNDFGYTGAQGTGGADAPKGVGTTLVNHLHGVLGYKSLAP